MHTDYSHIPIHEASKMSLLSCLKWFVQQTDQVFNLLKCFTSKKKNKNLVTSFHSALRPFRAKFFVRMSSIQPWIYDSINRTASSCKHSVNAPNKKKKKDTSMLSSDRKLTLQSKILTLQFKILGSVTENWSNEC